MNFLNKNYALLVNIVLLSIFGCSEKKVKNYGKMDYCGQQALMTLSPFRPITFAISWSE